MGRVGASPPVTVYLCLDAPWHVVSGRVMRGRDGEICTFIFYN